MGVLAKVNNGTIEKVDVPTGTGIKVEGARVGGLVGLNYKGGTIQNSYGKGI